MRSEKLAAPVPEQIPTDPYELLGVDRSASDVEIKSAHRKLALKYHPDRNPGDAAAGERMKAINEAKDLLLNPEKVKGSPTRTPPPPQGGFGDFFKEQAAREKKEKEEQAKRDVENEKRRKEREVEYERERAEAQKRREEEWAKQETERQQRAERERQEREERERKQQEEARLKEVERLNHEVEKLQDRYVGDMQEDFNHKYPRIFKLAFGDDPMRYGSYEQRKTDSEREISEALTKLASASQLSVESVKANFDATLREKVKKKEIESLNYWKGFLEKNIRYAEGEVEMLEQDLGKFDPRYKHIRVGKAAGRSMAQEFLRSKGLWPGLEKVRQQIQEKQNNIKQLQEGIKEIEGMTSKL